MSSVDVLVGLIVEMENTERVSIGKYKGPIPILTVSKAVVGLV